jgi:hypothetical protein
MLLILATGVALWIGYGALKGDIVIFLANAVSLALLLAILGFKLCGRGRKGAAARPRTQDDALRRSEERYRKVVEGARLCHLHDRWRGPRRRLVRLDSRRNPRPALRSVVRLFVEEDRAAAVASSRAGSARTNGVAPDVRWHLHKDGRRVFSEGRVVPIDSDAGHRGFLKIGQTSPRAGGTSGRCASWGNASQGAGLANRALQARRRAILGKLFWPSSPREIFPGSRPSRWRGRRFRRLRRAAGAATPDYLGNSEIAPRSFGGASSWPRDVFPVRRVRSRPVRGRWLFPIRARHGRPWPRPAGRQRWG